MKLTAGPEDAGRRLDLFLAERTHLTRSRIAHLVREGLVTVDGRPAKAGLKLRGGEEVLLREIPREPTVAPREMPLDIVYEDEDILVLNKPRGLVVHPAAGHHDDTLVNALWARYGELPGEGFRAGLIHRLDKDTSGLLVVAKTERALRVLQAALKAREIHRAYLALVRGAPATDSLRIEAALVRDPRHRRRFTVAAEGGRPAVTHLRVLQRFAGFTLLELRLETGRTHQIRVHLKHLGMPVLGDPLYGPGGSGQLLHAYRLGFRHPVTGEELRFEAPLPPDFAAVLARLRAEERPWPEER